MIIVSADDTDKKYVVRSTLGDLSAATSFNNLTRKLNGAASVNAATDLIIAMSAAASKRVNRSEQISPQLEDGRAKLTDERVTACMLSPIPVRQSTSSRKRRQCNSSAADSSS